VKEKSVRFSLQDVKKQVQRRDGDLCVSLHFLRPGELHHEIEGLVAFHEQHIGLHQRQFSIDDARAYIADYRLANCLLATLSAWYAWRQPDWKETLLHLGNDALTRLEEAGITSAIYLRLALFNYVNEHYAGFLDGQGRAEALQTFAAYHGLSVSDLEYLLALDSDSEAVLVREPPHPPAAEQVAALYNQWTFEAALFNASDVHFVIDCQAFMQAQNAENRSHTPAAGIGAVIKRLCYLARKLGVYYDLAYEAGDAHGLSQRNTSREHLSDNVGATLAVALAPILHLTLYGPQEMTGAPQQYGLRLARLCRMILGYASSRPVGAIPRGRPVLIGAIREAEATVHFLQRSYRFVMNADLLKLLPSDTLPSGIASHPTSPQNTSSLFDSSIEQSFSEAFMALANSQAADGWQLEREPEPLLLNSPVGETTTQSIFIPDFALTRGTRRIYVEILGFWTPSYRERKIARLQQLKERNDLVLAIPLEARGAFAAIAHDFPIVEYDGQLSATELLQVLRSQYDDFDERLARIDVEMVRERVIKEGLLPERACYGLLHCYRRSELQRATERVVTETIAFTAGVGLYATDWLEHLKVSFVEWLGSVTREKSVHALPLQETLRDCRLRWPVLEQCEDAAIEALISLWPEVGVSRSSIFEASIGLVNNGGEHFDALPALEETTITISQQTPKRQVRERRAAYKKRSASETMQGDLWG
jgi:predicted nuclease of restriction endonuclease-like RecB superfamily